LTRLSRAKIEVALVIEALFLAMLDLQIRLATQPDRWAAEVQLQILSKLNTSKYKEVF
jgi:hypothetical protein